VDRPKRVVRWRRLRARSGLEEDSGRSPDPAAGQPRDRLVKIDVTVTLPRRLGWLLAGIAISDLHLPDGLLEKAGLILRALLPG
jgi:hypothetical protein